jgi:hypothetical protein
LRDAVGDAEGNGSSAVQPAQLGDRRRVYEHQRDGGDQEAQRQVVGDVHPGEQILGQEERRSPRRRHREQGEYGDPRVIHAGHLIRRPA